MECCKIKTSKYYNTIRTVVSSSQQFLRCETEFNYKICFYSYHTSSSNRVRYNIYMNEEFPRCSSTKIFGAWSPMVQEVVNRIVKELQLLNPSLFSNILRDIGGFHMEKF